MRRVRLIAWNAREASGRRRALFVAGGVLIVVAGTLGLLSAAKRRLD